MKDNYDGRLEIERSLWEMEKRQNSKKRIEYILKLYSVLGLFVGIFGIIFFIFITLDIKFNEKQQIALLSAGVGLSLSIASWILLKIRREKANDDLRKINEYQKYTDFIWIWSNFEEISKDYLLRKNIKFNRFSIREIIEHLLSDKIIESSDIHSLEQAMQIRNTMVHGGKPFPIEIIRKYSKIIEELTSRIITLI